MTKRLKEVLNYAYIMMTSICTLKYINSMNGFEGFLTFSIICLFSIFIGICIVFIEQVRMSKKDV